MEIAPGWDEQKPVRFVLETGSGEQGFLDVNLSGVNARQESGNLSRPERLFFTKDPWAKRKWSPGVRAAIESGKIIPGMTIGQVWMSWGEPEKVTRVAPGNNEKQSHPGSTLLFRNGVLAAFQQ